MTGYVSGFRTRVTGNLQNLDIARGKGRTPERRT